MIFKTKFIVLKKEKKWSFDINKMTRSQILGLVSLLPFHLDFEIILEKKDIFSKILNFELAVLNFTKFYQNFLKILKIYTLINLQLTNLNINLNAKIL
ncbi:hypothetical protein BpHYR1_022111 [Brachionus plicatilis]|uniref:Uncharacterized protein n=1 Tax=Brachionus plicatilis TaxID=10195 RepID=A0A3M7SQM0_BRAPC|nr:hypothetical protein BpHYR1_022111 [Brachionus plicatilis]